MKVINTHYTMCFWFEIIYIPFGITNVVQEHESRLFYGSGGTLKKLFVSFSFPLLFEHAKGKHKGVMKLNVLALLLLR